jgi:hypothetical protein
VTDLYALVSDTELQARVYATEYKGPVVQCPLCLVELRLIESDPPTIGEALSTLRDHRCRSDEANRCPHCDMFGRACNCAEFAAGADCPDCSDCPGADAGCRQ